MLLRLFSFTFVSFNKIVISAGSDIGRVPANAELRALDTRDPDVAYETRHARLRRNGNVHVFRFADQRRYAVLGEHLEAISSHRVQAGYRNLRIVEDLLSENRCGPARQFFLIREIIQLPRDRI